MQTFRTRWLERFGLPLTGWKKAARTHLQRLPFVDPDSADALLVFLFDDLPKLLRPRPDEETTQLAEAFA